MVISGIIRPPPDIRAVADKTALHVSKKGRAFEARILNSEKGRTPQFAFMHETSPFHAYYEDRIRFYERGGVEEEEEEKAKQKKEEEEKKENGTETKKEKDASSTANNDDKSDLGQNKRSADARASALRRGTAREASAVDPVARALLRHRADISSRREALRKYASTAEADRPSTPPPPVDPPPPLDFVRVAAPSDCPPSQCDVIKLTAQFVALQAFTSQRRQDIVGGGGVPPTESFLKELARREWRNRSLGFVQPRHASFAYFTALVDSYRRILEETSSEVDDDDDDEQKRRGAIAAASEDSAPLRLLDRVAYRAEYDRDARERAARGHGNGEDGGLAGAADVDWHDFVVVETVRFPVDEVVEDAPPPPPSPSRPKRRPKRRPRDEDDMEQSSDESDDDDDDAVLVDESYTPNVVSAGATLNERARTMVVDPISGKSVPIDQLEEHMRIQLLDPKWAEQRRVFMERQKETNLGAGDIADYVARFVKAQKSAMAGDSANVATTTSTATAATVQQPQPLPQPQPQPQPQPPMMDPANQLYLQQQQQQQQQQYMYQQQLLQQQQQYGVAMPYPQQPPMPPHYPMPPLPPTSVMPPPLPPGLPPTGMPPAALAPGLQPPLPPPPLPPGHPPPPTVSVAAPAAPDERATQGDGDGDGDGEDAAVPPSKRPRIAENEHDDDDDNVQDAANMDTNEPPPPPPPPQRRSFPATFLLRVRCPDEDWPLWKLTAGAILTFDGVDGSTATVRSVKELIHERLDGSMPLNKMKLRVPSSGDILKVDEALLRDCQGLLPEESEEDEGEGGTAAVVALDLVPKVRGGRK